MKDPRIVDDLSLPVTDIYLDYNGHEGGRRAGTESGLLAAALGQACELATDLRPMAHVRHLRDLLWELLRARFGDRVVLNGHPEQRLPNTLNVELSPVLRAMGVPPQIGMGALHFTLGRPTTEAEIRHVADALDATVSSGAGRFAAPIVGG